MSSTTTTPFLDLFNDVDHYKQTVCAKVIDVVRTSNRLAVDDFERISTRASCQQNLHRIGERILHRMYRMKSTVQSSTWNHLDVDEKIEQLIEVNDSLFERIASALDEAEGIQKSTIATVVRQVLVKPQLNFKSKIDNSSTVPFIPKIRVKPNARTPLPAVMMQMDQKPVDLNVLQNHPEIWNHPYFDEIEAFEPDETVLKRVEPQFPKTVEETKCLYVDDLDKLKVLMDHIEMQRELAIDLEHHSYRSYQGFTCLMQISSRTEDFLIDTLALRDELTVLNNIFTNPNIVKVFHGADWDVEWLQKDFGLYIVNMFDTHQAGKELNLPVLSLAYLLKQFCHIDANKQFQLADWRIRPLPEEYRRYAREDTHYLLYIYDRLRNQLLDANAQTSDGLRSVYTKSKMICQKVYKKPAVDKDTYRLFYSKSHKTGLDGSQLAALQSLYFWRDRMAREEDESPSYVLPDLILIQLAELLPRDVQGIRFSCKLVPELVEKHLDEIHRLLIQAIAQPLVVNDDSPASLGQHTMDLSVANGSTHNKRSHPQETSIPAAELSNNGDSKRVKLGSTP